MTVKPRTRVGRPPKEDAAETSNRIIDTAAQLFAAQGFAGTSIEQVASACSAGKDTIYRRFPSKIALFEAVVERMRGRTLERLEMEIDAAGGDGDALARLRRIARWCLTVNLDPERIAFNRIALSEAVVFGEGRHDQWESDPITDRLVALVSEAQAGGTLGKGTPQVLVAHLLHSIVFGPSNDAMMGRTTYAATDAQDTYFDQAWTLFLHGAGR
ncbi:MAG: TetR/AcrR family transcriptional regulator [Azospirillaceae bacterium]|nr:TetR/AcrR family transcriptional regulator [Azospirillaceae bacterium]